MKFSDYKKIINESLRDSIDDSDVLNVLSKYSIYNDRTKMETGDLLYKFDNRYSLRYDGEVFTLYRHGDRIHFENARNLKEIDDVISKWLKSYSLDSIEISDETEDDVKALINKIMGDTIEASDDSDKDSEDENDVVDDEDSESDGGIEDEELPDDESDYQEDDEEDEEDKK